jgi:hypothetical protein
MATQEWAVVRQIDPSGPFHLVDRSGRARCSAATPEGDERFPGRTPEQAMTESAELRTAYVERTRVEPLEAAHAAAVEAAKAAKRPEPAPPQYPHVLFLAVSKSEAIEMGAWRK